MDRGAAGPVAWRGGVSFVEGAESGSAALSVWSPVWSLARTPGSRRIPPGIVGSRVRVPAVVSEAKIGTHGIRVDGDLIVLVANGEMTVPDIEAMQAMVVEIRRREGLCYMLVDLAGMTGLSSEARRQVAVWGQSESTRLTASAVYGCGFAMRALITLTLNAVRVLSRTPIETAFLSDEAAARAWIAAHRAAERAKLAGRSET